MFLNGDDDDDDEPLLFLKRLLKTNLGQEKHDFLFSSPAPVFHERAIDREAISILWSAFFAFVLFDEDTSLMDFIFNFFFTFYTKLIECVGE